MSTCDNCKTNGATPLQHCDQCNKNFCQHCHPEEMQWVKKTSTMENSEKIAEVSVNQKSCVYCTKKNLYPGLSEHPKQN